MRGVRLGAAAIILMGTIGAAEAVCPGLDILLEDEFEQLASPWGAPDGQFLVEDGSLVVTPGSGTDYWREHAGGVYDDIDMCLTVTVRRGIDPTEAKAGVIFWYQDVNNFYVLQIAPNRMASVWRRQRGKWLEQLPWQRVEVANAGDGGVNELRVTTVDDMATFFVNGSNIGEVAGTPPDPGQQIGIFTSSPVKGRAIFSFDSLRLTRP
ncbi:MAG: hypothetical protein ACTSU0_11230 [Alphaproteobacteria bacterium]